MSQNHGRGRTGNQFGEKIVIVRGAQVRDVFFERYMKDPITTSQDHLVIEVYVPIK